jgi:hypothetical protein
MAWNEAVAYDRHSPNALDYWDGAIENQDKIRSLANRVLDEIRKRVQLWERFDLGP